MPLVRPTWCPNPTYAGDMTDAIDGVPLCKFPCVDTVYCIVQSPFEVTVAGQLFENIAPPMQIFSEPEFPGGPTTLLLTIGLTVDPSGLKSYTVYTLGGPVTQWTGTTDVVISAPGMVEIGPGETIYIDDWVGVPGGYTPPLVPVLTKKYLLPIWNRITGVPLPPGQGVSPLYNYPVGTTYGGLFTRPKGTWT